MPNTKLKHITRAADGHQDYGEDPIAKRETGQYKSEYVRGFVDKWDELIDWDARATAEGDFFIRELKKRGKKRILDVATGTGFHSVRLREAGFDVTSADGSPEMLAKAFNNGERRGHILRTVQADWRWLNRDIHNKFDAVICLGNSFTHLFSERDRRKALAEFYAALRHDGILILDQRNYDSILDEGFSSKHIFYYCGENVRAEPEHVDNGLARFQYSFPDGSQYHLNMFPLRVRYTEQLMREVGFQQIRTFADFKETYAQESPDFYIHIAEKEYPKPKSRPESTTGGAAEDANAAEATRRAEDYYDSGDADSFYYHVWGGEDIHIGIYKSEDEPIRDASRRTVERMASLIGDAEDSPRVLDIGAGYGGSARHLASKLGLEVVCLNLSKVQNARNRAMNKEEEDLDGLIDVVDGDFENLPFEDDSFDIVWSQDSILHSSNRRRVFEEVDRVLRPGGRFVFTDPMMASDADPKNLQPVLDRIHLDSLGDVDTYRSYAAELGWDELGFEDLSECLPEHYSRVRKELVAREEEIAEFCDQDYRERMKAGLQHWVDAGRSGALAWGILHFQKPSKL